MSGYVQSLLNTFCVHYRSITGNKPVYLFKFVLTCISPLNGFDEMSLWYIIIPLRVLYIICLLQKHCNYSLTCLPDDTFLGWSILEAFADDKVNVTKNLKFVLGTTLFEKEIMVVTSIFSFFHNVFKSLFLQVQLK